MRPFQVGDHVEHVGSLVPEHLRFGRIIRVISHPDLPEHLVEYQVGFKYTVLTFYERQLRLVEAPRKEPTA